MYVFKIDPLECLIILSIVFQVALSTLMMCRMSLGLLLYVWILFCFLSGF